MYSNGSIFNEADVILLYSQSDSKQIMFWHLNEDDSHEILLLAMSSVLKCNLDIFRVPKLGSERNEMFHTRHNYIIKYLHHKRNVFLTPIITNFILH